MATAQVAGRKLPHVVVVGHNHHKTIAATEYFQKMFPDIKFEAIFRTYHTAGAVDQADLVIGTGWCRTSVYDGSSTLHPLVPSQARVLAVLHRKPYRPLRRVMSQPGLIKRALHMY